MVRPPTRQAQRSRNDMTITLWSILAGFCAARMTADAGRKKTHWMSSGFLRLAHSGGFEPPTARFVAEYSIQLSYECVVGAYYIGFQLSVNCFFLLNSRT